MAKETKQQTPRSGEDEFTVDMTTAKTLEPLPTDKPYLFAVSKWKKGKSANGRKVDAEYTVVEPTAVAGRKVIESSSLDNEYTLGHVKQVLVAAGIPDVEEAKSFKIPDEDEMLGLQFTGWVNIRKSDTYGDRNGLRRMRPAAAYAEVSQV